MKNPTLLCVANHPTGFGFAWTHFEAMYAGLAERMSASGVRTLIAYPKVTQKVAAFDGTAAEVIERDATSNALESIQALARFARHENVHAVCASSGLECTLGRTAYSDALAYDAFWSTTKPPVLATNPPCPSRRSSGCSLAAAG